MATSAGISAVLPRASLTRIRNSVSPWGSRGRVALHFDHHSIAVVQDEAGELLLLRDPIDEGPEADSLHDPADDEGAALHDPDCRGCDATAQPS